MDLVQTMGPDTATAAEMAPSNDTVPEPAATPSADSEPEEQTEKPISLEFLKKLMLQGVLTKFQTQWLLEGKFEEFLIDDYRIVDILGTGGMGWLYVGVNQQTGEKAAVKVISRHMDNDYLTRFKLEARAGLLLNHANIVRTLKLGETDEILYVVMELVEGISMQELIVRQGSLPWPQACSLVAQAAAGLQHAHEKGMVHRDVKPGNLLVKRNGIVKVLDFGLALMEKDEDEFTLAMISGQGCVGTADYISPEQTLDSFAVGPRADIYSLGCTLYCALTGSVPFPGESVAKKLRSHRTKDPRRVRELKPEVPEAVEQIVAKMMARKPEDRYPTAAAVAECFNRTPGATPRRSISARFLRNGQKRPGSALTCSASGARFCSPRGPHPEEPPFCAGGSNRVSVEQLALACLCRAVATTCQLYHSQETPMLPFCVHQPECVG